jgi:hypothetical protein
MVESVPPWPVFIACSKVIAALIADLAHDDAVGTVAQSSGQKLAWSDGNLAGNRFDCLPPNGIGMQRPSALPVAR